MNLLTGCQLTCSQCPSLLFLCVYIALFHSIHSVPPVQPLLLGLHVLLCLQTWLITKLLIPSFGRLPKGTGKANISRCKLKVIILGSWFVLSAATTVWSQEQQCHLNPQRPYCLSSFPFSGTNQEARLFN